MHNKEILTSHIREVLPAGLALLHGPSSAGEGSTGDCPPSGLPLIDPNLPPDWFSALGLGLNLLPFAHTSSASAGLGSPSC